MQLNSHMDVLPNKPANPSRTFKLLKSRRIGHELKLVPFPKNKKINYSL
jgi:hypothetical protein